MVYRFGGKSWQYRLDGTHALVMTMTQAGDIRADPFAVVFVSLRFCPTMCVENLTR